MRRVYVMVMLFLGVVLTSGAQPAKVIVGSIQTMQIDSTQAVPFEGVISFGFDTVAIEYWKPGKLNKSKILLLPVKNCKSVPGAMFYFFNNYEHDKLFTNGRLEYNDKEMAFIFKVWNKSMQFVYSGKLL